MYDLKLLRPMLFESKTRIGKLSDGGYILLSEQVEKTRVLLSFGVATDWSFESDFFKRREGLSVRMFDYSTSLPLILVKMFSKMVKLDFPKAIHYAGAASDYFSFIMLNDRVTLFKKYLSFIESNSEVTFEQVLRMIGDEALDAGGIFVKVDIEGAEYDLLPVIASHTKVINGIVVEFHNLDEMGIRMEEAVNKMKTQYHVVHVHGNNYSGLVPGTVLPLSLEVTFINKNLVEGNTRPDPNPYPRPGLDYPNDPDRADYNLDFLI